MKDFCVRCEYAIQYSLYNLGLYVKFPRKSNRDIRSVHYNNLLPAFPQCYCQEIREILQCLQKLSAVLISCLVIEIQKTSSPGLEPKRDNRDYFLCCCNLSTEISDFCLGIVLLSCLISELKNDLHRNSNPGHIFRG
jgi:hypothetical protein